MESWLEYDWKYEGHTAIFGVDMSSETSISSFGSYALTMLCQTKKDKLTNGERRKYEALKNKMQKNIGFMYVGFIETDTEVRFVFYVSGPEQLSEAENTVRKLQTVTFDCVNDPKYSIYFNLLFPNHAKLHTEETRKALLIYKKRGDNFDVPRLVNLHMYFSTEPMRIMFEEQARLSGYAIGEPEFCVEYERSYGVCIRKMSDLHKQSIDALTSDAIGIAEKYDGILSYWDADVVLKRR